MSEEKTFLWLLGWAGKIVCFGLLCSYTHEYSAYLVWFSKKFLLTTP